MRAAACLPILFLLAACNGPGLPPLPTDEVRASLPPHGVANVIEINALTRLPLVGAALIAPDGKATPASSVEASPAQNFASSQATANRPYAGTLSAVGGIEPSIPLDSSAAQSQSQILAMVSTASIPLPDPVTYRRDWQRYRVRLRFGAPPGAVETREIAAPEPPAGG